MGIIQNFRQLFAEKPRVSPPVRIEPEVKTAEAKKSFSLDSPNPLFGFGLLYPASTGLPVSPYSSLQHPTFYAGVRGLADDIARMPLLFERRLTDGWVAEDDHDVIEVLRYPNEWQTAFNMWHFTVTSLKIWGQAYLFIDRDYAGTPIRLVPIIPSQCSIMIHSDYEVVYSFTHALWNGGGGKIVPASDMLHFRDFSLDGGLRGIGAAAVSQDALGTAIAAQTHAATMFRDGTLLQGLLRTPNKLSTEGAARMAESWKQANTGATNAHRVAVLEEGLEYQAMAQTAEEAQLLEARKYGGEDAARILRVPPHKVGNLEHATFSNIEQQNLNYLQDALLPIAENIQAELTSKLLIKKERKQYRFRWDFSSLLQTDTATQFAAFEKALLNGMMTINEVRAKIGLPPDPDGDKLRAPLNVAPIDQLGNQPTGKPTTPKPKGDEVIDPDAEDKPAT